MTWLFRHLRLTSLLLLAGSEALVLEWAWIASGRDAVGAFAFGGVWVALAGVNLALIGAPRLLRRRRPSLFRLNRSVMLVSLGALLSGPLLLCVFALSGLLALALGAGQQESVRSALVVGGGGAVALGFGAILWGFLVGQRRVSIERVELALPGLARELSGVRVAHITDLHVGPQLRAARLRPLLERVNELDPDLIVITGDLFDFDPAYIEEGCRALRSLHARHGVYAVLGNHDVYTGAEAVAAGLAMHTGICLLRDQWMELEIRGHRLYLLGIDDPGRGWGRELESEALERLAAEVPSDAPRILLMHRPSYFRQVVRLGLPVALAGHTHGGQLSLPVAHHHNIARLATEWTRGRFEDGKTVLYVNRGLGVAGPPVRLNCPPEITLHRLVPAL